MKKIFLIQLSWISAIVLLKVSEPYMPTYIFNAVILVLLVPLLIYGASSILLIISKALYPGFYKTRLSAPRVNVNLASYDFPPIDFND